MPLLAGIGGTMLAVGSIGAYLVSPARHLRQQFSRYYTAKGYKEEKGHAVYVTRIHSDGVSIVMPPGVSASKFIEDSNALDLMLRCPIKMIHQEDSRIFRIKIAQEAFKKIMFYDAYMETEPLAIPLHSPFGTVWLDFSDEVCTHLLIGGATRMGKTVLLRLIITHILLKTKGAATFYVLDNKLTDLQPFFNIPQIKIGSEPNDFNNEDFYPEIRKQIELRKSAMLAAGRDKYSSDMPPIFIIVDEYGRFADDPVFKNQMEYIAETAGFANVHLIIATQRPDVTGVMPARVRANLITRFAFTTADAKNSELIIGSDDAAYLGRIQGRAIYHDGFPQKIQVPFLTMNYAKELLQPYVQLQDAGRSDNESTTEVSDTDTAPSGTDDLPGQQVPASSRKPRTKKTGAGQHH